MLPALSGVTAIVTRFRPKFALPKFPLPKLPFLKRGGGEAAKPPGPAKSLHLKIIIPALIVPIAAVGALFSGVLPAAGAALPFLPSEEEIEPVVDETLAGTMPTEQAPEAEPVIDVAPSGPEGTDPSVIDNMLPTADRAGYLSGVENGLALIQTTRVDSPTHEGWVDITLDLVATNFSQNPLFESGVTLEAEGSLACLTSEAEAADCFSVQWGSELQFKATLVPQRAGETTWAVQKAEGVAVTFEVPANAQRATLVYGAHEIEIPLGGQTALDLSGWMPIEPYRPISEPGDPVGTEGYFVGLQHGVAVTSVTRTPHVQSSWSTITMGIELMTFRSSDTVDVPITINATNRSLCFSADGQDDCLNVLWGEGDHYDAMLTLDKQNGTFHWPRSKGWSSTVTFAVPNNTLGATLLFGDNSAPLDLRGEVGEAPAWDYTAHYEPLTGLTLHDIDKQSIDLVAIDYDNDNGDVQLVFEAVNRMENQDFYPRVRLRGGRVSAGGQVLDGLTADDWALANISPVARVLPPGQTRRFKLVLPRVEGEGFTAVEHSIDPPEAMLLNLVAFNAKNDAGPTKDSVTYQPFYVLFDKTGKSEAIFYFPDLGITDITLSPATPTVDESVEVSFEITNLSPRNALATTFEFSVDDALQATLDVPAIPAHGTAVVDSTWVATLGVATLSGKIDPDDLIAESTTDNNTADLAFPGGILPDLQVGDVSLVLASATGDAPFNYHVEVLNTGPGRADASQANIFVGTSTKVAFFMSTPVIESGASATLVFPWITGIETSSIRFVLDAFAVLHETDETNNVAVIPLPDLAFSPKLEVEESEIASSRMSFEILNTSTITAPAVGLTIVEDAGTTDARTTFLIVGPMLPAESLVISVPVDIHGRHTFSATLDITASLAEANEDNNLLAFTYTVGPLADLQILEVLNRPTGVKAGETANTRVEVVNNGERDSPRFMATLYEITTGDKIGEAEIPALDRFERYAFKLEWVVPEGATGVRVVLDEAEAIAETDELNNEAQSGL